MFVNLTTGETKQCISFTFCTGLLNGKVLEGTHNEKIL